ALDCSTHTCSSPRSYLPVGGPFTSANPPPPPRVTSRPPPDPAPTRPHPPSHLATPPPRRAVPCSPQLPRPLPSSLAAAFRRFDIGRRGAPPRASGDGRVIVVGEHVLHLQTGGYSDKRAEGGRTPGPDGRQLFGRGVITTADGKPLLGERGDALEGPVYVP